MNKHVINHLGEVEEIYFDNQGSGLEVGLFKDQPQKSIITYSTINMSNNILETRAGKFIRHELIFSIYDVDQTEIIPQHIISFAESIIKSNKGLMRGEVVGPGIPFVPGSDKIGLYMTIPVFFEDSFFVDNDSVPPVVYVWMMPVTGEEIDFIQKNGWGKFEDILEGKSDQFWDIKRKPFC